MHQKAKSERSFGTEDLAGLGPAEIFGGSAGKMYDTGAFRELLSGINSDRMNKSMPEDL